ncbi:hypothetical protein B0H34DRAFT_684282 [Crassisporium funariophilum]|nr:hypothetical protein B0H34DRAFT_684282 [Crassisporium funariophilum]
MEGVWRRTVGVEMGVVRDDVVVPDCEVLSFVRCEIGWGTKFGMRIRRWRIQVNEEMISFRTSSSSEIIVESRRRRGIGIGIGAGCESLFACRGARLTPSCLCLLVVFCQLDHRGLLVIGGMLVYLRVEVDTNVNVSVAQLAISARLVVVAVAVLE